MIRKFDSLFEAFPDEQAAIDHLRAIRWRNGKFCPYCGSDRVYHFSDKRTHKCGECRRRFSIKVGTIFEDSKIPLRKWFAAIWMVTSHKKGIASTQLAKDLKVTQKTAWFMLHRLRHAARTSSFNAPLKGDVEADETYVGGNEKNKHAHKRTEGSQGGSGKATVFGVLKRGGELRVFHTDNLKAASVQSLIRTHVVGGSNLMTDEHPSFVGLQGDYNHHAVNHSGGEYVRHFFCHTNGIEGAWSLFKRQIYDIRHWISEKHLSRYLAEMTWRYNSRDVEDGLRVNHLLRQVDGRLTYKALIA